MASRLTLVVALFINPTCEAEFVEFESKAAKIMLRHQGSIERRIGFPMSGDPDQPHEVHVVTFPDSGSFERYRADPELQALAELRTRAIARTVVWRGRELPSLLPK